MKEKIKKIKKGIVGISLALALGLSSVKAQPSGSVELIKSLDRDHSYIRPTLTYDLPKDISGHSFVEFYDDGSFFGKTTLTKPIDGVPFSAAGQFVYGSDFDTQLGFGGSASTTLGEKGFVKIHYLPIQTSKEGQIKTDQRKLGYFVSLDLPRDVSISSFGELTFSDDGPAWGYGELSLEKKVSDRFSVKYQPALKSKGEGKIIPKYEHRLGLELKL